MTTIEVGDWVAFANGGKIVYAKVEYIAYDCILRSKVEGYWTTEGFTGERGILEVRKAKNEKLDR